MDIVTYVLAKNSVNSTIPDAIEDYLDTHPIHIEEVDPTVPSWAKQPTKPSYTAQEVGAYVKPSDGIPASDLASAVQTSLGKADTALQSAPVSSVDGKTGSVTILPSGGSTGQVLKKTSATDYAVEWANESGGGSSDYNDLTNKPSINGVTLGGNKSAADLSLAAAADVAAKEDKITEVTISTAGAVTQALDAGKIYHFTGALTALTITLNAASGIAHYHFDFDCGSTAPTVTFPNTVVMPDGNTFESSMHYEVDILNNYGAVLSWANS